MTNAFGFRRIPGRALARVQETHPAPSPAAARDALRRAEAQHLLRHPWTGRAGRNGRQR